MTGSRTWSLIGKLGVGLATLTAAGAWGQQAVWPMDGAAFSASVEEIRDAAAKVTAEKFAETTVLFERDAYSLDREGRATYRHSIIYRIETQTAVEGWSEIAARWAPWYQNRPEIHARVIDADGKVSELDQKTIADGPASEQEDETYTDARIRKAPLPGLKVGSIVEEETVVADKQPFFPGGGVYRDYFSRPVPIVRSELLVDAPREAHLEYRVHLMPEVKIADTTQDGVRNLKFDEGYQSGRGNGDIELASHEYAVPMVEFSTGDSWAAVAGAYSRLAEPQIDLGQVQGLVSIAQGAGRMERIQAVVNWLNHEIRYTGVEFGEASLQPQKPAEVLKRHFGDCKDKAALLVALLRSNGIPANLALLDAGPGVDVTPDLPGMNQFDHAIVYVPADKGSEPLWIDATDEYAEVGTLPQMDQGRQALIIAEGTTGLTAIPLGKPEDNTLTELRDVTLAEDGAAHITETSLTHGPVDSEYRREWGGAETREKRTNLETFAKNYYFAKALTNVEHGDGKDFSKPFLLKLDMAEAKRGFTGTDDASVGIPFSSLFQRLPEWFRTDPGTSGEKLTPQQEENRKRAVAARVSDYDVAPFVTEWRYTITPPQGFELRALPEDKDVKMGPARMTSHYAVDGKGVVTAVLRFDTVKPRYTVDEALALRDAVLDAYKQDIVVILFDQVGAKLMAAGKIREALAADRSLIEQHPQDAVQHADFAYALLQAGLGDRARAEARQAVQLNPNSEAAYKMLGWVCEFNAIGVRAGHGSDRDCSEQAYAKAVALDGDDLNAAIDLAIAYESDADGNRYSPQAHLDQAIAEYKAIKEKDKATGNQYEDYMLWDLLYSGRYAELLTDLGELSSTAARNGLAIAATVAEQGGDKGVKAGLERADQLAGGAQDRSSALAAAGDHLMHLRMYQEAAAILSASAEDQSDSAQVMQRVGIVRRLTAWNGQYLPETDPRGVVQRMIFAVIEGNLTRQSVAALLSRHAYGSDEEWDKNYEKLELESEGLLHLLAEQSGMPPAVMLDLLTGNMTLTAQGSDEKGYVVSRQNPGAQAQQFFVSRDEGKYLVVTDGTNPAEAGNEVLYLLRAGRDAEARSLLNWMRDRIHLGGGDDPLSGPLFPRFWAIDQQGDPATMRRAAVALLAGTQGIKPFLPEIRTAWKNAARDEDKLKLGLLLGVGYWHVSDGPALKQVSAEILQKYPDSYAAIELAGEADSLLKDWKDWNTMLDTRIAKRSDDENLLRLKSVAAETQGDFVLARASLQKIMDMGKAGASDYNNYAWTALFDGKVDADVVKAGQQATMLTNNGNFATLHTLACIYAYQGKTTEARDLLLKAMKSANQAEPNPEVWFAFAMIYEKYGLADAAREAYEKVEKPEAWASLVSTYTLAQERLKVLAAAKP